MKKGYYLLLAVLLQAGAAIAQQQAKGIVYNDANGNGKKDRNEKGISKVPVSNGVQVVLTDDKGNYELPITDNTVIFVIKPSGYRVPVNQWNLPQFYYIHKPKGSPSTLQYKGVAPTGPLPSSVDFALVEQTEPDQFKALVFGDPQVNDHTELGYYKNDVVSEVEGVKGVAFGLSMGDMVQQDLTQHKDYAAITARTGIPWYNVIGNHDLDHDCTADSLNHETFTATFGPDNYSFNYGNTHFIILNDNLYPDYYGPGKGKLNSGFRPYQLEFIKNDLQFVDTSKLVVLAFHCPLYFEGKDDLRDAGRQKYFEVLRNYPHVFSLAAHTHHLDQNYFTTKEGWNGAQPYHELVAGATCGNWYSGKVNDRGFLEGMMSDGTPRGYLYLSVSGNQYKADYKVAGESPDYRIRLYHRKVLTPIWWDGRGFVYANFFMGSAESKLEYRIDEGKWKPMRYAKEPDPFYESKLYLWDGNDTLYKGRRPTEAADCRHLWKGQLPCDIGVGEHRIEVRATDMYGQVFTQASSYRIEEPK